MTTDRIKELWNKSRDELSARRAMWDRYGGKAPIHTRQYSIDGKATKGKVIRRVANDFVGEIVDDKTGFLVGNPIAYSGEGIDVFLERWRDWIRREGIADYDADWVLDASLCGIGYRALYRDPREPLVVKVRQLPPYEVVDWADEDGRHAVRYYLDGARTLRATYYGPTAITEYAGTRQGQETEYTIGETIDHLFPGCPIIPLENNSRRLGDCAKVLGLIDQVDRMISDAAAEAEQFRLAYVAIMGDRSPVGDEVRRDFLDKMRESGILFLPTGSDAKFVTKMADYGGLKILMDILVDNIYRFAKAVNPSKADTNTTTVALRQRMHAVRNKCAVLERKMAWAIREQARLVSGLWRLAYEEPAIDPAALDVMFTPNFPINLVEEAQFLSMTDGQLSRHTRFGAVSLVEDPDAEIERLGAERIAADEIAVPSGDEAEE